MAYTQDEQNRENAEHQRRQRAAHDHAMKVTKAASDNQERSNRSSNKGGGSGCLALFVAVGASAASLTAWALS